MKIHQIAMLVIIFSLVGAFINGVSLFDEEVFDPGTANINQSDIDSIYSIDPSGEINSDKGLADKVADALGIGWIIDAMSLVVKALGNALNLGSIFEHYIPGVVGQQIALLVNAITLFVYGWGGVQIWRKFGTKGTD